MQNFSAKTRVAIAAGDIVKYKMIQLLLALVFIAVAGWYIFRAPSPPGRNPASMIKQTAEKENRLRSEQGQIIAASQSSAAAANEAILKSAIQMYYASNGAYPQTLDGLIPGGYVSSVPRVDGYGIDYDAATGVVKYRRGYD